MLTNVDDLNDAHDWANGIFAFVRECLERADRLSFKFEETFTEEIDPNLVGADWQDAPREQISYLDANLRISTDKGMPLSDVSLQAGTSLASRVQISTSQGDFLCTTYKGLAAKLNRVVEAHPGSKAVLNPRQAVKPPKTSKPKTERPRSSKSSKRRNEDTFWCDANNVARVGDGEYKLQILKMISDFGLAEGKEIVFVFDAPIRQVIVEKGLARRPRDRELTEREVATALGLNETSVIVVPSGSRADDFLLTLANTGGFIISNDRFRNEAKSFPELFARKDKWQASFVYQAGRLVVTKLGLVLNIAD